MPVRLPSRARKHPPSKPPARRHSQNDPGETRRRLIDAAAECFVERGFRATTIRDVCARAGANIASVNYHFAGKLALYREVFRESSSWARDAYPLTGVPSADPRADLRRFVHAMIARLTDPGRGARHAKLMAHEMVEPTSVLDEVVADVIRPHFELLESIVARLLVPGHTRQSPGVRAAARAIVAQILLFRNCRSVLERLHPEDVTDARMAARAGEIAEFSLAALDGLRAADRPHRRREDPTP